MGNRILKESICMSSDINELSWFEEVLFYRLIVTVDDYGVYPANPLIVAHMLFPMKEISKKDVEKALQHLAELKMIRLYSKGGKGPFLQLTSWSRHQRLRNSRPKYPGPDSTEDTECSFFAETEEADPEETAEKPEKADKTENPGKTGKTEKAAEVPENCPEPEPSFIFLPLSDGSSFGITRQNIEEYSALYPAVDVEQELRSMRGWCLTNETRRKTRAGIPRFVNSWLSRAQKQAGAPPGGGFLPAAGPCGRNTPGRTPVYVNPFLEMLKEDSET